MHYVLYINTSTNTGIEIIIYFVPYLNYKIHMGEFTFFII